MRSLSSAKLISNYCRKKTTTRSDLLLARKIRSEI